MQDLDDSLAAADGAMGAEQAGRSGEHKHCLNCGTALKGLYCHACGQKDLPQRQSTRELLGNFISSFTEYEGKFINSIKYLVTRPGFLALDYMAGRRERYLHPVRMYAFISFIFFLIFFSLPDDPDDEQTDRTELTAEDSLAIAKNPNAVKEQLASFGVDTAAFDLDSTALRKRDSTRTKKKNKFNFGLVKSEFTTVRAYDSAQAATPEEERDGWAERRLTRRSIELNEKYADKPGEFGSDFYKASLENFSGVLFFLLPVFALLLKLLYIRRNYFYSEHLVFSIYYYNFFYFAGSFMMLTGLVESLSWLTTLIGWGIYLYLLFSMKRMYQQGWGKTIVKFLLFSFTFMFCFFIGYLINAFIIVMIL